MWPHTIVCRFLKMIYSSRMRHVISLLTISQAIAYPGILFWGGGSLNSVEDREQTEWGYGGSSPLVRGSGGSCNLVQEISFHMLKSS